MDTGHRGHRGHRLSRQQLAPGAGRHPQAGFTFAELSLALLVLVVVASVMVSHLTVNLQSTVGERDRLFAFGKAQAILAEIQSHVELGENGGGDALDAFDDGVVQRPTLTIATDENGQLVPADHPLSGNFRRGEDWVWTRRITVQPFPGLDNRNVRYVTVRVFQLDGAGRRRETADVSAVVNAAGAAFPTTQVFDLYLIAIENIPGWWVFMDSIRPFVESTITDLETRNPGLEVRTHWITTASYGRNQVYRPHVNNALDSLAPIPQVYHYPGRMPAGSASTFYYVPSNIRGRIAIDGIETNGWDQRRNPHPYALCDWFNHSMRHPEELALWQQRVRAVELREAEIAAARAAGNTPPAPLYDMSKEPTLRLLLDDLYTHPERYRNALVINLHGELLPMPAIRNYSDAARDPVAFRDGRVVTHPEQLRTRRDPGGAGSENPAFRVYAFGKPDNDPAAIMPMPIALEVVGLDLTDPSTGAPDVLSTVRLTNLRGGVPVDGDPGYAGFAPAKVAGTGSLRNNEMFYAAEFVPDGGAGFTRILLFNTPCVAPAVLGRGLLTNERARPYGLAYLPSPGPNGTFTPDLSALGAGPKNTARWRLEVPAALLDPDEDTVLEVRTRIWTGPGAETSGTMWPPSERNAPDNLSRTYTWFADSPEDVPATERAQFLGDPRHCPYRDLLNDPAQDFPNGYNWYFDSLENNGENAVADFAPGLDRARLENRWRGYTNFDVPRLMELLRKGLVRSRCVFTTLTGFSYYYLGIGAEIGYDTANGYPNSIPVDQTPYGAPGSAGFVNNITGRRTFVRSGESGSSYWWSLPWLGELCPDSHYQGTWLANDAGGNPRGNLPAGSGSSAFRHVPIEDAYGGSSRQAFGVAMQRSYHRLQEEGCTSFFNTGTASSTFHHQYSSGYGGLTPTGAEIASNYNFNMPAAAPISRPFDLQSSGSGTVGTEFNLDPYRTDRFGTSLLRLYYTHPSGANGSGLVQLTDPADTASAFVVVNGIDKTVESGSNFIAKYSMLSLVHSFFEAGATTVRHRIEQPPRVEITSPTDITELVDPLQIDIEVATSWARWDGLSYTAAGSVTEDEAALDYVAMYSRDGGESWLHVRDDSPATPGERPLDPRNLVPDAGIGPETFSWTVNSHDFPQGSYYVRVDCFRRGAPIHFSYHQTKIFIQRR